MTTAWLLLLLVVVSYQNVNSQSTTDYEETCADGGLLSKLQGYMERMLDNQQQLFHQQQSIRSRLG